MPDITSNLSVAVQATETKTAALDVYLTDLTVLLDVSVSNTGEQTFPVDMALAYGPQIDAQLDMWIGLGGAASQLFQLDTSVSTPLIIGDHVVSDSVAAAAFGIANLDDDVVSIALGPNQLGVTSVTDFVNNGDGTGSFTATFDTAVASRQLSIVAIDDVDNESAESPFHIVNSLEQARLNDVLSITPQDTVSSATCDRLLDSVPASNFTLKRQHTVPYSFDKTVFELRSVTPNAPVEIVVVRRGLPGEPDETQRYVIIPQTSVQLVSIRLGRGTNVVSAFDQYGRADTAIVAATTYASILCSYAREIYNVSRVTLDEQEAAVFSPTSTRLAEPLIEFPDLLPDVRSQQTLASKLAIRGLVSGAGRQIGVRDVLAALTLSTPIFVPQLPDDTYFDPPVRPLFNSHEAFGGVEAHVWPANACVQRWLAFVRYISNVAAFDVIEITEQEVLFRDNNGDVQRHVFDFTTEDCSLTTLALQALCFDSITVGVSLLSESDIPICAAAYPLDFRPSPTFPVRPLGDEFGVELALDPGFDGYVGASLTRHWDEGTVLDSFGPAASPTSGLATCVYPDGYLVAPLLLASGNVTIDADPTFGMTASFGPARSVELDLLLAANDIELTTALEVHVRLTSLVTGVRDLVVDVSILGIESVSAGLDVLISA
jgi:hypothetical protein